MDVVLSECLNKSHNFANFIFYDVTLRNSIGQPLTGFCVYVSVVVRRFATGDVFGLFAVNILNLSRPRLINLAKIWKPLLLL